MRYLLLSIIIDSTLQDWFFVLNHLPVVLRRLVKVSPGGSNVSRDNCRNDLLAWPMHPACCGSDQFHRASGAIFAARCVKCHGEAKAQGKLRLDSAASIEVSLAAKPKLLVVGKPEDNLLYQRLTLPAKSPKRMPKGGDPLVQDQLDLVAEWIRQGAVLATVNATAPAAVEETASEKIVKKPSLPKVAAAPQSAIDPLLAAGAGVTPLFAGSNLLEISFADGTASRQVTPKWRCYTVWPSKSTL